MTPTNRLRWYAQRNHPTVDTVRAYAYEHDLSMMQAKMELVNAQPPVLQQWWESAKSSPEFGDQGEWRVVPTEE